MRLDEAVTTNEILKAVAGFEWWEVNQAECPQEAIPTQSDLAGWGACPSKARNEANSRLSQLFEETSGAHWYAPDGDSSMLVASVIEEVVFGL